MGLGREGAAGEAAVSTSTRANYKSNSPKLLISNMALALHQKAIINN